MSIAASTRVAAVSAVAVVLWMYTGLALCQQVEVLWLGHATFRITSTTGKVMKTGRDRPPSVLFGAFSGRPTRTRASLICDIASVTILLLLRPSTTFLALQKYRL